MKSLPNKTLNVGGRALSLPDGCHVDCDWRRVANGIGHDSIMLVENYEVFDQLHELAFDLPDDCKNPLVIYRGDKTESRLNNVKAFIDASDLPVLAFVDIDPKGLHIAVSYPRLIGVVAPDYADLKATMDSPASARPDLYRLQLPGVGDYLRSIADNSPISALWKLLQQHRTGVVQERWLVAEFKLVLWDGKRRRRF